MEANKSTIVELLIIAELLNFYENRIIETGIEIKKEIDRGSEIDQHIFRLKNLRNLQLTY